MIVVDTNVICYRWMASARSELADQVWQRDPEWIAPSLWRSEFRNALAGALRHKLVGLDAAIAITENAELQFAECEYVVSSRSVLRLISASLCSAYDCEFVALAQQQSVALVTENRAVLRAFPEVALSLEQFLR